MSEEVERLFGTTERKATETTTEWDRRLAKMEGARLAFAQVEAERERLDVGRLAEAMRPVTRHLIIAGGDKGYESWLAEKAETIAREYAALAESTR